MIISQQGSSGRSKPQSDKPTKIPLLPQIPKPATSSPLLPGRRRAPQPGLEIPILFQKTPEEPSTFSALPGHRFMPQNFLNSCAFLFPHKSILPEMRNVAPCCGPTLSTRAEDQGQKSQSPWLSALSSPLRLALPGGPCTFHSPSLLPLPPLQKDCKAFGTFPKPRLPIPSEAGSPVLRPKHQLVQPSFPCNPWLAGCGVHTLEHEHGTLDHLKIIIE